jgi:hypothetical protein
MTLHVFCGPSLAPSVALERVPEATVKGPAACGDVYLAARDGATAIAIIDGYFDHRLSVWHKEILWAVSRGIPVYGAASMGALRAAELSPYGMIGVGAIYRSYRDGALEDDDEVAVLHEPFDRGYRSTSDALVNIRATLQAASQAGVIDPDQAAAIIGTGKSIFYPDRTFEHVVEATERLDGDAKVALKRWFAEHGLIDLKRLDATELIERLAAKGANAGGSTVPNFHFSHTNFWRILRIKLDRATRDASGQPPGIVSPPLTSGATEQAAFSPQQSHDDTDPKVMRLALERALALTIARLEHTTVSAAEIQTESERFRRAHGLLTPEATARWLTDNAMDLAAFSALARDEVLARRFQSLARALALAQMPHVLRSSRDIVAAENDTPEATPGDDSG